MATIKTELSPLFKNSNFPRKKPFYLRSLLRNQQQLSLSLLFSLLREGWRSYLNYIDELEEGPANKFLGKESIFYKKYSPIWLLRSGV